VVNTGKVPSYNFGLSQMTGMAGPQFRQRIGRYTPYGQFLLGAVRGFNSVFPPSSSSSATGFIFAAGGGSEMMLSRRFSARLIEVDLHVLRPAQHQQRLQKPSQKSLPELFITSEGTGFILTHKAVPRKLAI